MNAAEARASLQEDVMALDGDMLLATQEIIQTVRNQGDAALRTYTQTLDGVDLEDFWVKPEQLKASWDALDTDLQKALKLAKDRIIAYEERILYEDNLGEELSYIYRPLERVGVYIPGGTALYPSSVLMTVLPAQVAGVGEIIATTPTFNETNITFAALYLCGVERVLTLGGAQAIAALAYGTESVPKVDKIVGPGNAYVAMAKRLVFGDVGIDSIAGPSEILLYVDDSADVDAVVYDVFAQAEHDTNARTFLLSEDAEFVAKVESRIEALLPEQVRRDIIAGSLANHHYVVVDERKALLALANDIAAEHVSIQHREQEVIAQAFNYAGAVFVGAYSPEAVGDYVGGPSHVLPTNQTARFSHGLNANDFRTSHAIIQVSQETFETIAPAGEIIAQAEGLDCHRKSLAIRRK